MRTEAKQSNQYVCGAIAQDVIEFAPTLTLRGSTVTDNSVTGGPGVVVQGGGLYTKGFRVTRERTVIAGNTPDQCLGC